MTRSEFKSAARRTYWIGLIGIIGCTVLMALALYWFMTSTIQAEKQPNLATEPVPDGADGARYGILIGLVVGASFGLPFVLFMTLSNRFFGLRCPNCHRYITLRCRPEIVLESGHCPFCHTKLFEGGED